jgi:multiple sugar transport system ATP-binding protein
MAAIFIDAISRSVSGRVILDDVSLDVADGEMLVLIGPSGCGKSSILRSVAGLDPVPRGRILMDGEDVTDWPTQERDVSMVFQDNVLLDTRTARGNISFPLDVRKQPSREIHDRVLAESRALEIEEILDRWPRQISHGHAQLVQIARALVRPPSVFLLDEPLSSLDPPTRARMRQELRSVQSGYGVTMLYATNDPEEALSMGDRIAVLFDGRVVQVDTPRRLWLEPLDLQVAELLGPIGTIPIEVSADGGGFWLTAPDLRLRAWAPALASAEGTAATLGVRPDAVRLDPTGAITGTAGRVFVGGPRLTRAMQIGPALVAAAIEGDIDEGAEVRVGFDRFHVFDPAGRTIATVG